MCGDHFWLRSSIKLKTGIWTGRVIVIYVLCIKSVCLKREDASPQRDLHKSVFPWTHSLWNNLFSIHMRATQICGEADMDLTCVRVLGCVCVRTLCECVFLCARMYVLACVRACMHACEHVCVRVRVWCVCMCVCISTCVDVHAGVYVRACMRVCVCVCMCVPECPPSFLT